MRLYSKAHFAVRHAASKDARRYHLNGIHFLPDGRTEATDGNILIRVEAATPPADEFPTVPGVDPAADEPLREFILPTDAAEHVVKSIPKPGKYMPILSYAVLDVKATNENGNARFVTTDLETAAVTEGKKIEGVFPKTDQVIPKGDGPPTICFDLILLERIAKAAREFGRTGRGSLAAKFWISEDKCAPILIRVENPDVGELTAVLMPMRI